MHPGASSFKWESLQHCYAAWKRCRRTNESTNECSIAGMLPGQVKNIGGSIGIFLEKYSSLIGKNTQNIGVYRRSFYKYFTSKPQVILSKYSLLLRFPSRMFEHSTFVTEVGVLPQKILKSQIYALRWILKHFQA